MRLFLTNTVLFVWTPIASGFFNAEGDTVTRNTSYKYKAKYKSAVKNPGRQSYNNEDRAHCLLPDL